MLELVKWSFTLPMIAIVLALGARLASKSPQFSEFESRSVENGTQARALNRVDHLDHGLQRECLQTEKCR